jgi:hypothetical protein
LSDATAVLQRGRSVTILPRNGGHSWAGTVLGWKAESDHVVAEIECTAAAVSSLDHHQVWLSTVSRNGDEYGVTIFAGRASANGPESLALDGVVRLADERRRHEVRGDGSTVSLPAQPSGDAAAVTSAPVVAALDLSRGAVRLPVGDRDWLQDEPLEMVVHLGDSKSINVVGRVLRIDEETNSVVLRFEELAQHDAEALERYVLEHLPAS